MENYIIEHPTRGTLKFFVSENEFGFSTTGLRNDPDKTMQFHNLSEAHRIYGRLPEKIRVNCKILTYDPARILYVDVYPPADVT